METLTMELPLHRDAGVEWCVASRALPGESLSGDLHVVARSPDGVLLGVVDGLGHGGEATLAARKAVSVLADHAGEPVVSLVQRCHRALRETRGVVMTLVFVSRRESSATALGVGNVEAVLVHAGTAAKPARESVLLRNGVVGYRLPALQASVLAIAPGDVLVFATDGVREDFGDSLNAAEPLPQLLERLVVQKFRGTDDALVLACRILADHES